MKNQDPINSRTQEVPSPAAQAAPIPTLEAEAALHRTINVSTDQGMTEEEADRIPKRAFSTLGRSTSLDSVLDGELSIRFGKDGKLVFASFEPKSRESN